MATEDTTQIRLENHLTNLSTVLYSLYETSTLVDVTLACDGGNLFAHKVILSASSPFFAEIFASNPCKHPVIVLRSQNFADMKYILEFMYRGFAHIEPKFLKSILKITRELEIKGFEKLEYMNSMNMIPNIGGMRVKSGIKSSDSNIYSRDTRFKGTKRVMVNFEEGFTESVPKKANSSSSSLSKEFSGSDLEPLLVVDKEVNYESDLNDNAKLDLESPASELMKTNLVDLDCKLCSKTFKNRNQLYKHLAVHRGKTFRCDFCHKCFTRSSHLIRHRRVHTGERPYECKRCGKAFARQDKLKLHIKASHEVVDGKVVGSDSMERECEEGMEISFRCSNGDGRGFQIGQVQEDCITRNDNLCASEDREHYILKPMREVSPIDFLPETTDMPDTDSNKKRGRGRPRKYPPKSELLRKADKIDKENPVDKCVDKAAQKPVQKPTNKPSLKPDIEKPVAKPILNPLLNSSGPKRGRGRPRKSICIENPENQDNYDLNNLPFGDLNLLTMPLQQEMIEMPNDISDINTNVTTDDRSQDPLNINSTNTNTTEIENILGLDNLRNVNIQEKLYQNSNYSIDNQNKDRSLDNMKLLANLNSLTDITITAQPNISIQNGKANRCHNGVDVCNDDDNCSSSMDSTAAHSNDSDIMDIDVVKHEPLSDTDGDLVIDENHCNNDIVTSINKINIVDIRSNVVDINIL